jgi:hypothetical protein
MLKNVFKKAPPSEVEEVEKDLVKVMNILVIGKGKTGTTVISKTIQKSILGNTVYHLEPKNIGFFEQPQFVQPNDTSHIVKMIFEHWATKPRMRNAILHNEAVLKFHKVVCIVRDLRDEMISRLFYLIYPYKESNQLTDEQTEAWLKLLKQKEEFPQSVSFVELFKEFERIFGVSFERQRDIIIQQSNQYFHFIQNTKRDIHVLKYEDFISRELTTLQDYLGFQLSDDQSVGDLLGRTKRSASFNNWKKVFTEEDVDFFKPKIASLLENFGYTDWELDECNALDSEHYSNYVKRLINEDS